MDKPEVPKRVTKMHMKKINSLIILELIGILQSLWVIHLRQKKGTSFGNSTCGIMLPDVIIAIILADLERGLDKFIKHVSISR